MCSFFSSWDALMWHHLVCITKKVNVGYCGKLSVVRERGLTAATMLTFFVMHTKWRHVGASQLDRFCKKHMSTTQFQGTTVQILGGDKNFPLLFTFKLIRDNAKWLIHELICHIWLSIRLNFSYGNPVTKYSLLSRSFTARGSLLGIPPRIVQW